MSDVLTTLMSKLLPSPGGTPAISANGDEFWLRANDRFDIRASWVHEERSVELSALLRAPEHESLVPAPEADHPDWHSAGTQEGEWRHMLLWHPASSTVAALSRGPVQALDEVSFPAFVEAFIDRLEALDQVFNGSFEHADI